MEKTMEKIVALAKSRGFIRVPRSTEALPIHGITATWAWSLKTM